MAWFDPTRPAVRKKHMLERTDAKRKPAYVETLPSSVRAVGLGREALKGKDEASARSI